MISTAFRRVSRGEPRRDATDAYVFVMLLVFPLFTGFKGYAAITVSKFLFFAVCTAMWLTCLAVFTLKNRRPAGAPASMAQKCALCFMAVCCSSAAVSPYLLECILGAGRYDGLVTLLLCALIFLGTSAFGSLRRYHARAFAVSCTLCCLVAALQLMGLNPLGLYPGELRYYDAHLLYSGEFLGTIGNVNMLSALLSLAIPLFFSISVLGWDRYAPLYNFPLFFCVVILTLSQVSGGILAAALCAVCAPALLVTGPLRARRALCSAGVCLLALALALSFRAEPGTGADTLFLSFGPAPCLCLALCIFCLSSAALTLRLRRFPSARALRVILGLTAFAVLAAVLCVIWFRPGTDGAVYELSQAMHGRLEDSFGSSRILIWRNVLALVPERPLFGGGPGTLPLRLEISFSRFVPETGLTLSSFVDNAHNEYLRLLADTGALGLAAYLALLLCAFARCFRRLDGKSVCPVLLLSLLCYCIQDFFGLGLCLVSPLFWILLGLSQRAPSGRV